MAVLLPETPDVLLLGLSKRSEELSIFSEVPDKARVLTCTPDFCLSGDAIERSVLVPWPRTLPSCEYVAEARREDADAVDALLRLFRLSFADLVELAEGERGGGVGIRSRAAIARRGRVGESVRTVKRSDQRGLNMSQLTS